MSFWAPIAAQAASSVVGKILGGGSSGAAKEARHYAWEQQQMAKQAFYEGIQIRMADAKKAGVHPLAALGFNPANVSGPNISAGTDTGESNLSGEVGQAAGRAVGSLFNSDEKKAQRRLLDIQLEGAELDNAYKRSQIALLEQSLNPPMPGGSTDGTFIHSGDTHDPRYPGQAQMPMGYGDTAPLLRTGKDPHGDPIRVYNDDLGDNEVLQALSALGLSIPDLVANAGKRTGRELRKAYDRTWWNPKNWKK